MSPRASRLITFLLLLPISAALILAGALKLLEPAAFARVIASYEIAPDSLSIPLALYLPWLEIVLGVALWSRLWRAPAGVAAIAVIVGFSCILLIAWRTNGSADCGCMGSIRMPIPLALARNAALVALLAVSMLMGHSASESRGQLKSEQSS